MLDELGGGFVSGELLLRSDGVLLRRYAATPTGPGESPGSTGHGARCPGEPEKRTPSNRDDPEVSGTTCPSTIPCLSTNPPSADPLHAFRAVANCNVKITKETRKGSPVSDACKVEIRLPGIRVATAELSVLFGCSTTAHVDAVEALVAILKDPGQTQGKLSRIETRLLSTAARTSAASTTCVSCMASLNATFVARRPKQRRRSASASNSPERCQAPAD